MRSLTSIPSATVSASDLRRKYDLLVELREGTRPGARDALRTVQRPPRGRLGPLVFEVLGARFSEPPAVIWQALFPTARADRFEPLGGR